MSKDAKSRFDIHQAVTDKIIKAIEAGAAGDQWTMPWHRPGTSFALPKNALTDKCYRGINVLSLWIDADEKKYPHPIWATYKQWQVLGAQVGGGEKSSLIVKYGEWQPKGDAAQQPATPSSAGENSDDGKRMYAKAAYVFNIDQVDNYPRPETPELIDTTDRLAHVDQFIQNTKIEIREGGSRAFYCRPLENGGGDFVQMPPREYFIGTTTSSPTESYYATELHECLHATGSRKRLDRQFGKRFGDNDYAFEELLVEIGAATMCCTLGITSEPRPDHAQYVQHWLTILKGDNRAIFTASAAASKAIDYLYSLQPVPCENDG